MAKVNKQDGIFLKKVGERITQIREEKKLTQVELGYELDMDKSNVNRLEDGENSTILKLRKICKALGVSLSEFFEGL